MIFRLLEKIKGNEFDRLLKKTARDNRRKFLIAWNRGLGDIALGLYALTHRIRTFIPDAQITFLTRKELEEAFYLLDDVNPAPTVKTQGFLSGRYFDAPPHPRSARPASRSEAGEERGFMGCGVNVIGVSWWRRGAPIDMEDTLGRLNIKKTDYDIFLEKVNPTKWLSWQRGKLTPRLRWKEEYDNLWERFNLHDQSQLYIGVHVNTETQEFYGYRKDLPVESWKVLFEKLSKNPDTKVILFGLNKRDSFNLPSIIDLRGETSLLEILSIIKNRCKALIAPDGGVLSITYYLDVYFPITVISLWVDVNHGIMKQAVPSPNKGLIHIPLLIGKGEDISDRIIDEIF